MPKKGHTEEQIIAALKQYESGEKVAEICRKLGVSQASFCIWKKQYAGWACRSCVNCASYAKRTEG
jgi:putative transposase